MHSVRSVRIRVSGPIIDFVKIVAYEKGMRFSVDEVLDIIKEAVESLIVLEGKAFRDEIETMVEMREDYE